MKNKIIKGTLILSISSIIAKFLGIFFRWPLVMLIGDEGIGYYQMTYPLYMFFIGIVSGMPIAVSKFVSERSAYGDKESIVSIIKASLKIMIFLGVGTSIILLIFSNPIINLLKWDNKVYLCFIGISIAPISVCLLGVFRGVFQGMENMMPTGISQIIEQIIRVLVGVSLAYFLLDKGIHYAAGGASFGAVIGGIIATIFIVIVYSRFSRKYFDGINRKRISGRKYIGKILKIAIPLSLGATVSTIMVLIDSILVPQMLLNAGYTNREATILYGQLTGKVSVIINVPLALAVALGTSMIPTLSRLFVLKKMEEFRDRVIMCFKLSSYIAFPCFIAMYFLAYPIMNVIFPNNTDGYNILRYAAISIPFIIFSQVSISILQSTNNYIRPVINLLIGCFIKVVVTLILTGNSEFNIYGAVLATIFSYILTSYLNFSAIKKKLNINLNILDIIITPLFSSLLMIIISLLSFDYFYKVSNSTILSIFVCGIIGGVIYILSLILFKMRELSSIFTSIK